MAEQLKYIRLGGGLDEIVIFPMTLEHSSFEEMNPISAGFCIICNKSVKCYGESVSLELNSMSDDSNLATKQVFGLMAMLENS